jgi:hypothetical protein
MKSVLKGLPQPVPISVPSAVDRKPDSRQKMMEQELSIASEIPEFFTVGMGVESLGFSLRQAHGLSCFTHNTDMIEMDRMKAFIFCRNDHHSISGNLFIHGDIDAQEKANDQKADQNDYSNFALLRFSHRSVLLQDLRLN